MEGSDIYQARTGNSATEISKLMDRETWLNPKDAVEKGFADRVDETTRTSDSAKNAVDPAQSQLMAKRRAEAAFAKAGYTRADRVDMINALSATPRDASRTPAARDAGDFAVAARQLLTVLKS